MNDNESLEMCWRVGKKENCIRYTGQQYDQVTGQYYLRARYYNPVIGRFTQEDTYRGDGLNLYAYCGNNPVMYYDPSGHEQKYSDDFTTESGQSRVEQVDGEVERGNDTVVYHSVGGENDAKKIQSVLDGIDIRYTSPDSRFGQGFYVSADGNTTVAELAYHGTDAMYSIRYDMHLEGQKVLDLTDSTIANEWGYFQGGSSLLECQNIAKKALNEGYNVIKVQSYRDSGINYVIYDNFDEILQPQIVTPIGD